MEIQTSLFPELVPAAPDTPMPSGFRYRADLIGRDEEAALLKAIASISFEHFIFRGFLAKRKVAPFGYRYDEKSRAMVQTSAIPSFLLELRTKIATFAGRPADDFKQAMIIEYEPGVTLGWHRDRPYYGEIVGVSLLSSANFRLRLRTEKGWSRVTQIVEPRSAYIMAGESRSLWEHSIPPVAGQRYSLTFRTLANKPFANNGKAVADKNRDSR
jgi:alkylated DNA repair dioxygenase AlkB